MKMSIMCAVMFAGLVGCAGNQSNLSSQIDALEKREHQMAWQLESMKEDVAKTKAPISDGTKKAEEVAAEAKKTASEVWDWVSSHSKAAWDSEMSVDARERFQKCWNDLSKKGNGK